MRNMLTSVVTGGIAYHDKPENRSTYQTHTIVARKETDGKNCAWRVEKVNLRVGKFAGGSDDNELTQFIAACHPSSG